MNYLIHYKLLFIFSFLCIVSSVLYLFINTLILEENGPPTEEPYSNDFPRRLSAFNLKKMGYWRDLPSDLECDIFTPITFLKEDEDKEKKQLCVSLPEVLPSDSPFPVSLKGWSGANEKMVFVFSALNSTKTFIGTVGDSFDNPSFTIMSFDLKTVQDDWNLYSIPVVTILDKERDRLITLAPAAYKQAKFECD